MLRRGLALSQQRTRSASVRSSVSAICESQRYFSDNKHDDNNNNGDALKVFFEKRRAALQKEKQQNRNQTQQRWSKQNQRNEKQVQEQNVESFIRENTDATKEKDSLSSFFEKRRAVHNNNNMNKQKRGKRQSDSNKNRKWVKGNKATDNWSNSFQNQNKPNNGRRGQQHNSNQQNQNNNNDSSRLADLMKQLRRDAPPVKQNSQTREPFWRQGVYQNNKSKEEQRWSRASFLNKPKTNSQNRNNMRRNPQRNNRYQYQQKEGSEFLEGRLTRKQDSVPSSSPGEPQDLIVTIPNNSLTLTDISSLFRVKVDAIQRKLRNMGEYPSKNEEGEPILDVDLMELLALEYGIETVRSTIGTEIVCTSELLLKQRRRDDEESSLPPRPPVVCIMGHVDHGKTTLMDALRRRSLEQLTSTGKAKKEKSKKKGKKSQTKPQDVAGTEAGGITQIISAFQVALEGQRITFLDTPGHAAFKSMRQSGSHAADVIVLVIAADDGISPQTLEILNFYKQICEGSGDGNISLVVALNKIDKPGIVVEEAQRNIENQLLEQGIIPEGMNGDSQFGSPVQVIPTSGLTGQGLDDLMEGLLLQSEVMDLRADDKESAEGIIMDTAVEKGLGVVATAIIRFGTIRKGDVVVSGDQIGRVKILKDVFNKPLKQAMPSQPVTVVGFKDLPKAGDPITVVESEEKAEELVERRAKRLETKQNNRSDASPANAEIQIPGMRSRDTVRSRRVYAKADLRDCDGYTRIPVIVKADADGSLSAIRDSLLELGEESKQKVLIDPVSEGIGDITPGDIQMAKESNAVIFLFGSRKIDQAILNLAEAEDVQIRSNAIIYSLLDEARDVLGTYLAKAPVEHVHGSALVQAIFSIGTEDGEDKVAGLKVLDGYIYQNKIKVDEVELGCNFRVLRNGKQISPKGEIVCATSLRRYKELVDSVRLGDECGLSLSGFSDFQEGDTIECYSIEMKSIPL